MNGNVITNAGVVVDRNIRMDDAIVSYGNMMADKYIGCNDRPFANFGTIADHLLCGLVGTKMFYDLLICFKWFSSNE